MARSRKFNPGDVVIYGSLNGRKLVDWNRVGVVAKVEAGGYYIILTLNSLWEKSMQMATERKWSQMRRAIPSFGGLQMAPR